VRHRTHLGLLIGGEHLGVAAPGGAAHPVAVAAVVALTAVNCAGIPMSALLTRVIVTIVLAVLAAVMLIILGFGEVDGSRLTSVACCRRPGCCSSPSPIMRITTLGAEVATDSRLPPQRSASRVVPAPSRTTSWRTPLRRIRAHHGLAPNAAATAAEAASCSVRKAV
jgi:hypothetical protein